MVIAVDGDTDAIEFALSAEEHLQRCKVHHGETFPQRPCDSLGAQSAADRQAPLSDGGEHAQRIPNLDTPRTRDASVTRTESGELRKIKGSSTSMPSTIPAL